jgi:predicted transcriptional regulator
MDTAEKKALTIHLHDQGRISQAEIAKIVGVSRQMVHRYLREVTDG